MTRRGRLERSRHRFGLGGRRELGARPVGGSVAADRRWHASAANAKEFDRASQDDGEEQWPSLLDRFSTAIVCCFSAAASSASGAANGLPRGELAARCGLQDLIGIPIGIDQADRGLLLFFAMEIGEAENALVEFLG